jgi:serine/threonine protein phosphatase 1
MSGIYEDMFIVNGGFKTVESYRKHGYDIHQYSDYTERHMPRLHITFFQNLMNYYETEEFIFVHAGIKPGVPMSLQPTEVLFWDRDLVKNNEYKGKTVVFGHTPDNTIMNEPHKICIDTGAAYDSMGDLTCVKLPERTFYRQGWGVEDLKGE